MSPTTWIAITAMAAGIAAFAWVFRRFVTLFAALDTTERLEDNRPVSTVRKADGR